MAATTQNARFVQGADRIALTDLGLVVGSGWAAASNTKLRTTFDTTTVTTAQLAARVGALIDDLLAAGVLSA